MDDEDFKTPYITDTISNPPAVHQLLTKAKRNVWIVAINEGVPITFQGTLDELNCHQTPHGKSKVNISLYIMKIYQRTDLEEIRYIFDQVIPVVSHI